jgi:hypothetical protein
MSVTERIAEDQPLWLRRSLLPKIEDAETPAEDARETLQERESLSHDSIMLASFDSFTLDSENFGSAMRPGQLDFSRIPNNDYANPKPCSSALRLITSEFSELAEGDIEWEGFGIDSSFVEASQHFVTRRYRHRQELMPA